MVFNNGLNDYYVNKYYFQEDKEPININEVDTKKIVLSNKLTYGEYGANKCYIAYLNGGFKPLYITIKNIKLYTNHMNVLASGNELLKYIEKWNNVEALFNKKFNKKGFYSKPTYNNEYIKPKIISYYDFKKLRKNEYCGNSILLLESIIISEVKKKILSQNIFTQIL